MATVFSPYRTEGGAEIMTLNREQYERINALSGDGEPLNPDQPARLNHGQEPGGQRTQSAAPEGKTRLSVDIPRGLYQKLRIYVATTNKRINTFIEELIEKQCR
jgi:hypothetical protein